MQVCVILELCLQCLIQFGVQEVIDELKLLVDFICEFLVIFVLCDCIMGIIVDELCEVCNLFVVLCCIQIVDWVGDMDDEDLIECEDMVVIIILGGYIKCMVLVEFWLQCWGGKGLLGMVIKEDDVVMMLFVVNIYIELLFFIIDGMVYWLKIWCLFLGGCILKGKVIVNILLIQQGILIVVLLLMDVFEVDWDNYQVIFVILDGDVCCNVLLDFINIMCNGKIVMKLFEGVELIGVWLVIENDDVMLVIVLGWVICFQIIDVWVFCSCDFMGVCGIWLVNDGDRVVLMLVIWYFEVDFVECVVYLKMCCVVEGVLDDGVEVDEDDDNVVEVVIMQVCYVEMLVVEDLILIIIVWGVGKISFSFDYLLCGCGGQGVIVMDKGMCGGELVVSFLVECDNQIILVILIGQLICVFVDGISFWFCFVGGVCVFNMVFGEIVVLVVCIVESGEDEFEE